MVLHTNYGGKSGTASLHATTCLVVPRTELTCWNIVAMRHNLYETQSIHDATLTGIAP